MNKDDVSFVKKVLLHPKIRMKRLIDLNDKVKVIKQVLVHPKNRMKKDAAIILEQQKSHLKNRMSATEARVARNNVSRLMCGEFDFSLKIILNKTMLFDTSKINEEVIMDKIIEAINDPLNDEYYIDHPEGSSSFTLKREDGR